MLQSSVLFFMYISWLSSAHLRLLGPQQQPEVRRRAQWHCRHHQGARRGLVAVGGPLRLLRVLREHPRGPRGARQLRQGQVGVSGQNNGVGGALDDVGNLMVMQQGHAELVGIGPADWTCQNVINGSFFSPNPLVLSCVGPKPGELPSGKLT